MCTLDGDCHFSRQRSVQANRRCPPSEGSAVPTEELKQSLQRALDSCAHGELGAGFHENVSKIDRFSIFS